MPSTEDRRSALVHPDFVVLIGPNGTLRRITLATNMRSKLVMMNGKKLVLTGEAEEAEWEFLSDHVDEDTLAKIHAHLKAEQTNPFKCKKFDEKLLPKICRDRIKASLKASSRPGKKSASAAVRAEVRAELLAEMKAGMLEDMKAEVLAELKAEIKTAAETAAEAAPRK